MRSPLSSENQPSLILRKSPQETNKLVCLNPSLKSGVERKTQPTQEGTREESSPGSMQVSEGSSIHHTAVLWEVVCAVQWFSCGVAKRDLYKVNEVI